MPFLRWILILGLALATAACKNGQGISGYDGDSPAASETDWCSQSPPSGYCNSKGD